VYGEQLDRQRVEGARREGDGGDGGRTVERSMAVWQRLHMHSRRAGRR
jgi:hypothetical protein